MEDDQKTKSEKMDEVPDAYVAEDLYEDEDLGITVGVSPTRELEDSPPHVEKMEVDESSRSLKNEFTSRYGDILELGLLQPLVGATTSAGSATCFSALLFVAISRAARART